MAIGSQIGSLYVRIGADTGDLDKGMKKAGLAVKNFAGVAKAATLAMVAVGTAVTAAAATFVAFTRSAATSANELANLARVANTGVESFQKWSYAARTVGIEQDKLADILKDVNDRVGEFMQTGGGPMKDFFTQIAPKIGITANAFRNLSGPQALQLYYDSLVKAGASQQDLTFYMEAMASDSTRLLPLLKDSGEAFKELGDQAARTGIIMSQLDVAKLQDAFAQFQKLGAVFEAIKNQIAIALAPVVSELLDRFTDGSIDVRTFGDYAVKAFRLVATAVAYVIDAVNDFRRDLKGLQVMGDQVNLALTQGFNYTYQAIGKLIDFVVEGINQVIQAANSVPGIDIPIVPKVKDSAIAKNLESMVQAAKAQLSKSQAEFLDYSNTGSAVDWVNKQFDAARKRSEELANTISVTPGANGGGANNPSAPATGNSKLDDAKKKEHEAYVQSLNQRLEALRQSLLTEQQTELEAFYEKQDVLAKAREEGLKNTEDLDQMEADLRQQFQDKMTEIDKRAADERKRIQDQEHQKRVGVASDMMSNLATLMDSGNKKMFQIGKVAAISRAILSGYEAVTQAYRVGTEIGGPPVGAAFAATAAAATAAQIAAIKNTQFGAGGGTAGGGYSKPSDAIPQGATTQPARQNQVVTIALEGGDFYSKKQVRGLITQINEALDDGAKLNIA